jgi:uncharacterized protein YbjT (DUF2867 family)
VLVAGATGLVGTEILRALAEDEGVERITALTRRPIDNPSPKIESRAVDFDDLEADADAFAVDQIFCALGTTIRKAGSQEQFRRVDHDYPLAIARLGAARGVRHLLLVTALGADPGSRVFYNRVKGEVEEAVRSLPYRSLTIARPSLLLGDRREWRIGEEIGKVIGWIIPGRYRPVPARDVAAALVGAAREDAPGVRVMESDEIRRAARAAGRESERSA